MALSILVLLRKINKRDTIYQSSILCRYLSSKSKLGHQNFEYERVPRDKDEDIVTSEILRAALNHVNTLGWNINAIKAGAEDMFMSSEISGIFKDFDLPKFFINTSNNELETHLSSHELSLKDALKFRLQKVIPYTPKYSEALAHCSHPSNVTESLRLLLHLSDSIAHHSLKDKSTDINWYTKRVGIGSIYATTELTLLQDKSEGFRETFEFLERRVKDYENFKFSTNTTEISKIMSSGFTTAMNILGRNPRR